MKRPLELLSPMEDADLESPTQSHSDMFTIDQRIRAKGYTIKRRPVRGEAVWERNKIEFTQRDVIFLEKL